jgi:hypothetical protein
VRAILRKPFIAEPATLPLRHTLRHAPGVTSTSREGKTPPWAHSWPPAALLLVPTRRLAHGNTPASRSRSCARKTPPSGVQL